MVALQDKVKSGSDDDFQTLKYEWVDPLYLLGMKQGDPKSKHHSTAPTPNTFIGHSPTPGSSGVSEGHPGTGFGARKPEPGLDPPLRNFVTFRQMNFCNSVCLSIKWEEP